MGFAGCFWKTARQQQNGCGQVAGSWKPFSGVQDVNFNGHVKFMNDFLKQPECLCRTSEQFCNSARECCVKSVHDPVQLTATKTRGKRACAWSTLQSVRRQTFRSMRPCGTRSETDHDAGNFSKRENPVCFGYPSHFQQSTTTFVRPTLLTARLWELLGSSG